VTVFKGHRKAVSYVKFLNRNEIVSACVSPSLSRFASSRFLSSNTRHHSLLCTLVKLAPRTPPFGFGRLQVQGDLRRLGTLPAT
jgi:hypothetical protein